MNRVMPGVRSALDAILGNKPAETPLQLANGDLREATARRLGIPLLKRPVKPAPRVKPNRADRRAALRADEHARSMRLDTYARRLTIAKENDQ